jgi:tetratricopeptide (TPR) repeat protein
MNQLSPTTAPKPAPSTFRRGIILVLTLFLAAGTIAAQQTGKPQEDELKQLLTEGMQLMAEGSSASLEKAILKFESARLVLRSLDLRSVDAFILTMIASAYSGLKQDQKAIEKYSEALPLLRAAGEKQLEAATLLQLGLIYDSLNEFQKSLDFASQAVLLFRAAGDHEGEALALSAMGNLSGGLGHPEDGLKYLNQALKVFRETGYREGEAIVLSALSPLYNAAGEPEKARASLEQALSVSRAARFRHGEALALSALGMLSNDLREIPKALEYSEQALPLFRSEHDRDGEAVTLATLCEIHLSTRDYSKGFDYCNQALAIQRANGARRNEAITLKNIAIGERDRGNLAAAQAAIESSLTILESIRTKVINPDLRVFYFAKSQNDYEFYIDLLMRLHKEKPTAGYDGKAFQASERARARYLLDTLKEANADIRQGVDPALLQRERDLQRRLNAKAQTQLALLSRQHLEGEANTIAEEVQSLIDSLQQVETEIRQASPHYAALMLPRPLTLKEIQSRVLDDNTILLEYSLGEEHSYLWAVTSTSITSHELAKGDEIKNAARDFYNLLNARNVTVKGETDEQRAVRIARADAAFPKAAAKLSRLVLTPVAGQLGKKRLAIVADGILHFVPFGALPIVGDETVDANRPRVAGTPRPLIADHEIVSLPSASTLAVLRTEVVGRQRAPRSVAVLADPVFMKDDERVKTTKDQNATKVEKTTATRQSATERQLIKAAQDTGMANGEFYVPRLPGTRREAEQIVAMVSPVERRLALDFAASRDTATSAELSQYRYVHLSTHGLLNSVHPELSGLVFSLVNERGEPQDGFLLAHEIFNLKLPAEVVVLSACETGIGLDIKGEGLVSLTRGFMYAGAPRVVVSLWGVSDLATTELMVRFYQGMLKEGMRPAAALRAAQLSLMNDKRWASPYYWAPFTLQGEWR